MIRLLSGDCRDVLSTLDAGSVQCVVTSPPYYGLRDYGTAQWEGGDAACDHTGVARRCDAPGRNDKQSTSKGTSSDPVSRNCIRCGARRIDRQIGLEPTPEAFVATLVEVFREVRRVLHPTGTVWMNLGDSYNANQGSGFNGNAGKPTASPRMSTGLAAKQLLMMPARVALALQADGWWLRSDIIWAKPNPMPESCRDRPTSAHEHVFLLTKRARYYYDADAVREDGAGRLDLGKMKFGGRLGGDTGWHDDGGEKDIASRNLRNVWTIATHAYSAAHFATYPPELVERCIRAGTSERGCCAACGAPWVRVTERTFIPQPDVSLQRGIKGAVGQKPMDASNGWDGVPRGTTNATTTGWSPSCTCGAEVVPCTVLDPFSGAGTTALVADRLQRNAIAIDLSHEYREMAAARIAEDAGMFAEAFTSWPPAEPPDEQRQRDLFREPEYGA